MKKRNDTLRIFVVIILIIFIAINITSINNFLSFSNDKTADFGHSSCIVPQEWNTVKELKIDNENKTASALTNGYIFIDQWDDWPEGKITSVSEDKFKSMEDGGYKVLKNENYTLNDMPISKQYFKNPSRNNDTVWSDVGVNYVFSKEDTNYAIQVHYFTQQDYNNTTFLKQIDYFVEDDITGIHNNEYNAFVSTVWHIIDRIVPH